MAVTTRDNETRLFLAEAITELVGSKPCQVCQSVIHDSHSQDEVVAEGGIRCLLALLHTNDTNVIAEAMLSLHLLLTVIIVCFVILTL
jgi:hypothetical protein